MLCTPIPGRVGKTFDYAALREMVDTILNVRDRLSKIVNFDVKVCYQFLMLVSSY